MALRIFDMLQPLISQYPLLAFIYSICYKLLSHCLLLLDNGKVKSDSDYDFISILVTQLFDSINYFEEVYIATRNYSNAVFMTENKPGAKLSPKTVSFIYDQFCEESGTINYAKRPILRFSSPTITFKEKYGLPSSDSWIAYFRSQKNALISVEKTMNYFDNGLSDIHSFSEDGQEEKSYSTIDDFYYDKDKYPYHSSFQPVNDYSKALLKRYQ